MTVLSLFLGVVEAPWGRLVQILQPAPITRASLEALRTNPQESLVTRDSVNVQVRRAGAK